MYNTNSPSVVVRLAVLLSFMPFVSLYPLPTDVQPAFAIAIVIALFVRRKVSLPNNVDLLFLFVAIISIVWVDIADPVISLRHSFSLLVAFLTYYFFSKNTILVTQKFLLVIVLINFSALFFHFVAPNLFNQTLGGFVRTIKILNVDGARGASGFAAEPGFMGALSVFYLSVSYYLRDIKEDREYFPLIILLCILMVGMTKSGTGGLLLVIFFLTRYFNLNLRGLLNAIVFCTLIFAFAKTFGLGRAGYAVIHLFENPSQLFFLDSSVGQRVINISVGIISIFEFPFGVGMGMYETASDYIIAKYNLADYIAGNFGNVSAFAKYSVEIGILYWILLVSLIYKSIQNFGFKRSLPYLTVALFYMSASFSIVFPPIWFLFGLMHQRLSQPLHKA